MFNPDDVSTPEKEEAFLKEFEEGLKNEDSALDQFVGSNADPAGPPKKTNYLGLRPGENVTEMDENAGGAGSGSSGDAAAGGNPAEAADDQHGTEDDEALKGLPSDEDGATYAGKYKSVEDLEKGYLESQKELGRLRDENGQLRGQPGGGSGNGAGDATGDAGSVAAQQGEPSFDLRFEQVSADALTAQEQNSIVNTTHQTVRTRLAQDFVTAGEAFPTTVEDWFKLQQSDPELYQKASNMWSYTEEQLTKRVTEDKKLTASIPQRNKQEFDASKKVLEESYGLGEQATTIFDELKKKHGGNPALNQLPNSAYFDVQNGHVLLRPGALELYMVREKQTDIAKAIQERGNKLKKDRAAKAGQPDKSIASAGNGQQAVTRNIPSPETWNDPRFKQRLSTTPEGRKQIQVYRQRIAKLSPKEQAKYFPKVTHR